MKASNRVEKKIYINSKLLGSTLFIVTSPFQCMCMLEAIRYFNIRTFKILVTYSDEFSLDKINLLLKRHNLSYSKRKIAHLLCDVFPIIFSNRQSYNNIFIGDFQYKHHLALAYIASSFRANFFYLDDGVQTLSFFSSFTFQRKQKLTVKIVFFLYKIIGYIKFVKRPVFFTIFNVSSSYYQIIKNPLTLIKNMSRLVPKDIFIIGTNSSIMDFDIYNYFEYITAIYNNVYRRFPLEKVYYCPHRRDSNLNQILELCDKLNIKIFNTKIAVEYDFIDNNISPKLIIGFTSNALITLHTIYPKALVESVEFRLRCKDDDIENQIIRSKMIEQGISTLKVL